MQLFAASQVAGCEDQAFVFPSHARIWGCTGWRWSRRRRICWRCSRGYCWCCCAFLVQAGTGLRGGEIGGGSLLLNVSHWKFWQPFRSVSFSSPLFVFRRVMRRPVPRASCGKSRPSCDGKLIAQGTPVTTLGFRETPIHRQRSSEGATDLSKAEARRCRRI